MKRIFTSKAFRYLFGILILIVLAYLVDTRSVLNTLAAISLLDVVILTVISYALLAVSVVKWRAFLNHLGIFEGFWKLFGLYLVGYFVNLLMPSFVGGDVVRSLHVGERADRAAALSATLLERYTGLAAMLLIAVACVWWAPNITPQITCFTLLCAAAFVVGSVLVFLGMLSRICVVMRVPGKVTDFVRKAEEGLRAGTNESGLLLRVSILSFVFHLLTVVNTAAVAYAIGWTGVPLGDLFVVVPLILLVGAIPISPQGLGIQEGAFVFFLHSIGATPAQAFSVGAVLRVKSYILAVLGAAVWLRSSKGKSAAAPVS